MTLVYDYREMSGRSVEWDDFVYRVEACDHMGATDAEGRNLDDTFAFCGVVIDCEGNEPVVFHCCDVDPTSALRRAFVDYMAAERKLFPEAS